MRHGLIGVLASMFLLVPAVSDAQSAVDEARRLESNAKFKWERDKMVVIEPERGRDKVGPIKPNWCDLVEVDSKPDKHRIAKTLERGVGAGSRDPDASGFHDHNLPYIFGGFCAFPDDPGYQEQAGYFVQYFVNLNGQSKQDTLKWMRLRADKKAWAKHIAPPPGKYPGEPMDVKPEPGRVTVGAVKPTWCDKVEIDRRPDENRTAGRIDRTLKSSAAYWFTRSGIAMLMRDFCSFPDHPGFQRQAGAMVQMWVNQTGQSKEDAIASLAARADQDGWEKEKKAGCDQIKAPEEASYEEEQITRGRKRLFCGDKNYYVFRGDIWGEYEWFMDRTDQPPSEIERVISVLSCLPEGGRDLTSDDWIAIGLCGQDVKALDSQKLKAETAKMPLPLQTIALESLSTAKAVYADLELMARDKAGSDPDYKRVLYDAPKTGWDAWMKAYKKNKAGFDATFRFEKALSAPRKSAVDGCWGYLEPEVQKFVKAGKFKTADQFTNAMRGPVGQVLINALGACYAVTSPASVGALFLGINKRTRGWRGPRAAVRYAMLDAMSEIKADRARFPLKFGALESRAPNLVRDVAMGQERTKIPNGGAFNDTARGVMKRFGKAKGKKETHRATFKSESWMENKRVCKETKRVDYIKNGKIYYRLKCRAAGKVKQTFTPNETLFYSWSTKGIKANAFVIMAVPAVSKYGKRVRWGFPVEVYTNKNKKKLVNMYGFKL